MLRNTTFAVLAVLAVSATAQAGLIASVEKMVNPGSQAAPYDNFARNTGNQATPFTTDTGLNSGTPSSTWVSYALGLTPTGGEKLTAISVLITSPIDATHAMLQRWNYNPDTDAFDPTPSSTNVTNGDTHLIQSGSVTGVAPNEGALLITTGGPPKPADVAAARQYGYSGSMNGQWGYNPTEQGNEVDGTPIRFAYIVVPRGGEPNVTIAVTAAASNTPAGYTFTSSSFQFPTAVPEPATLTLVGLALVGGLGLRRRRS